MLANYNSPIGIFDSGVGGLTVANAIKQLLPNESIIYYGDTAHLPYGDKSAETIKYYSQKITKFLIDQGCKVVVIACNTASALANEAVLSTAGEKALILNVIDPVVEHIVEKQYSHIGIIGTKGTINSASYQQKIGQLSPGTKVQSMATPLFVPMIEEGFIFDDVSNAIIRTYLSKPEFAGINSLVLGCTHYPIIKNQISKFFNFGVDIIDSAKVVAAKLRQLLTENGMLSSHHKTADKFYISDYTDYFKAISKMFFEEDIVLEKLNFWN
ncbi:MAG: glutamate racemase [Bacteroidales bacterium]|nr:glutamate racemase [Bacteroidales bacterium]